MSEKVDVLLAIKKNTPLITIFKILDWIINENVMYMECYTLKDWEWSECKKVPNDYIKLPLQENILYFSNKNKQIIGYYYYDEKYIIDLSFDADFLKKFGEVDFCINRFYEIITQKKDELLLEFAYIGMESYVKFSNNYEKMMRESKGVIKWIFN